MSDTWTGDTLTTYTGKAVTDMGLGAINDLNGHFDDIDDPVTLERRDWIASATVTTIIIHPHTELCPRCHGDAGDKDYCPHCSVTGPGLHPLAGQVEVL